MDKPTKLLSLAVAVFLSACANKDPVKSFADSATKLTTSFDSYSSKLRSSCQRKYTYLRLDDLKGYDAATQASPQETDCPSFKTSVKTLSTQSSVVSLYAKSLGELAGIEGNTFNSDIDDVAKQLSELNKGADTGLKDKDITALTSLFKTAAETTTDFFVERKIKNELRENHESLKLVVEKMKSYSTDILPKQLKDVKSQNESITRELRSLSYLPDYKNDSFAPLLESSITIENPEIRNNPEYKDGSLSSGSRLPYRIAQIQLRKEWESINGEIDTLAKFSEACDEMVRAHGELKDNFGKLSRDEMLEKMKAFYNKAKEVRENINTLRS